MFSLEVEDSAGVRKKDYYRVQKFSKNRIIFRKHNRAETDDESKAEKGILRVQSLKKFFKYSPQKLKKNPLGKFDKSK